MTKKLLIGSDPLSELFGEHSNVYYNVFEDFLIRFIQLYDITDVILCHPYDHLKQSVERVRSALRTDSNIRIRLNFRTEKEDSFDDIDLVFLLIRDDLSDNKDYVRPLCARYPNSNHLKTDTPICYKYSWQIEGAIEAESDLLHIMHQQHIVDQFPTTEGNGRGGDNT